MLLTDVSGLDETCSSADAIAAWNRTVEHYLSHDRETPASLAQALPADGTSPSPGARKASSWRSSPGMSWRRRRAKRSPARRLRFARAEPLPGSASTSRRCEARPRGRFPMRSLRWRLFSKQTRATAWRRSSPIRSTLCWAPLGRCATRLSGSPRARVSTRTPSVAASKGCLRPSGVAFRSSPATPHARKRSRRGPLPARRLAPIERPTRGERRCRQ
jgi:hypothetical protein